jgi:hypothetical protein
MSILWVENLEAILNLTNFDLAAQRMVHGWAGEMKILIPEIFVMSYSPKIQPSINFSTHNRGYLKKNPFRINTSSGIYSTYSKSEM